MPRVSKSSTATTKSGKVSKPAKAAPGTVGGGKKVSAYNKFMKDQLPKFKQSNPGVTHKEAFKKVAQLWANAKENPKNARGTA
ncbi:hypothetical protein DL89DRAFT_153143 [Linderina pennispora]|uniref:YABBY protein C-terminal domain-containing protein n=1 Tax=Linderina pennispora TaxID=61395 RepID=A0A1Y1W9F7_9FUNG|nr:uncharacterized protein DL89DRAFT_153143 [Linderina pennispora]ORX70161.1 hypothetical protein DL89DRAFT_153143 [Linderina pennispora]